MKKMVMWIIALATISAGALCAQDIAGDSQGTLHAAQGPLRIVLKISKADNGDWSAMLHSIDQEGGGIPVTSITLQHSTLKYSIDVIHGSYEGKVSADGASIAGSWTLNNGPWQLDFLRVTKEAAWAIPDTAKGHTQITVEPKVFDGYAGRYQLTPKVILTGATASEFNSRSGPFLARR